MSLSSKFHQNHSMFAIVKAVCAHLKWLLPPSWITISASGFVAVVTSLGSSSNSEN
jgi:hypothetical protein